VIRPLTERWGDVVEAEGARGLESLDGGEVIARFTERGAILFRGFAPSSEAFAAFADRFSARTLPALHAGLNRDRVAGDDRTMTVDLGSGAVGFHSEMGYSPASPDLLWFHCLAPAATGGETVLADGVSMLARMDPALAAQFRARRIKYVFRGAGAELWNLYLGEAVDRAHAAERLARVPGLAAAPRADGTFDLEYVTAAIRRTRFGAAEAFVNSIGIFESSEVCFEDGAPIDRALRLELAALATDCSADVEWRAGDVLMIDNSRLMHGRLPFKDPARRIHVRMSAAGF